MRALDRGRARRGLAALPPPRRVCAVRHRGDAHRRRAHASRARRRSTIVTGRCATTRCAPGSAARPTANGCGPIAEALGDPSLHLVLAAIDALAIAASRATKPSRSPHGCSASCARPPDIGSWHREAHALVAAAKRAPERAAMAMGAFRTHNVWQVRMYAARAAEPLKDVFTLEKLAYDDQRQRARGDAGAAAAAGGGRAQPAGLHRGARAERLSARAHGGDRRQGRRRPTSTWSRRWSDALERITAQKSETSRDTRLALMERLREAGGRRRRRCSRSC